MDESEPPRQISGVLTQTLVTDRERVVAEMGPPRETTDPVLAEGVRQGWLVPPTLHRGGPPPRPEPIMSLRDLLADLEGDRGER